MGRIFKLVILVCLFIFGIFGFRLVSAGFRARLFIETDFIKSLVGIVVIIENINFQCLVEFKNKVIKLVESMILKVLSCYKFLFSY